jgi:multicomponent Na+:H+ antiporter subunit D
MGLGLFTPFGLAGSVFYMLHDMLVKTSLFLVSGVIQRVAGTSDLQRLGGLYEGCPGVALLFLIPALSLAGMPPFSGFFAKLSLVQAGLECGQYGIVALALGTAFLTVFSMTTIWTEAFWKPLPDDAVPLRKTQGQRAGLLLPLVGLTALSVLIGFAAEPVFLLTRRAAEQLMAPRLYIQAVLGGT